MGKYMHYFQTESEYEQERSENYLEPWVSLIGENDRVDYNKTEDERLLETPFTIEALGGGSISWNLKDKSLYYSKNGGEWTTMTSATTIPVVAGDEVAFKGNNAAYIDEHEYGLPISSTARFNVKGNIMSLTNGDNFLTANTVSSGAFYVLFSGCTAVTSAENLKLPATTLATDCYDGMFCKCTSLTTAPELPATTLAENCYSYMFSGCTSLTTAPELPATTLGSSCYDYMFAGCTSLTTAPELPATTLATYCYRGMFNGCTNLNYIKAMFTTTPSSTYTGNWVNGVASTGTFVKNAAAQWDVSGKTGIPTGWTVETASA